MRPIDADELLKALHSTCDVCNEKGKAYCEHLCPQNDFEDLIDNAPTVEPQKIVTIPHELIEKLVLCVVDTVENIDWDKAIEAYKERPQTHIRPKDEDDTWKEDMQRDADAYFESGGEP